MHKTYKRIGLLDHMGFGNMGDAAVHESFVDNVKKRLPDACLIAFSMNPDDTSKRHNILCYPITWRYSEIDDPSAKAEKQPGAPSKLQALLVRSRLFQSLARRTKAYIRETVHLVQSFRVVKSLDLLIMAGGGQLCDLWWIQPYNIFKFCVLAKLARTPVFIVGVGADLIRGRSSKFFARWSVRLADYASFRDAESQTLIQSLGVRKRTRVCPDPAYALELGEFRRSKPRGTPALKVGLNPMGFCDSRTWPRSDQAAYDRYLDKLARFSSWLLARSYNLELFTSDIGVDRYAIEDLRSRVLESVSEEASRRLFCHTVLDLQELLTQMEAFDFVITPKFHGVVFSHLLGKPVIALSYLPKIDRLMRAVGQDSYCLDIERFDVESLVARFESMVRSREDLARSFRKATAAYRGALEVEFDNLFSRDTVRA